MRVDYTPWQEVLKGIGTALLVVLAMCAVSATLAVFHW